MPKQRNAYDDESDEDERDPKVISRKGSNISLRMMLSTLSCVVFLAAGSSFLMYAFDRTPANSQDSYWNPDRYIPDLGFIVAAGVVSLGSAYQSYVLYSEGRKWATISAVVHFIVWGAISIGLSFLAKEEMTPDHDIHYPSCYEVVYFATSGFYGSLALVSLGNAIGAAVTAYKGTDMNMMALPFICLFEPTGMTSFAPYYDEVRLKKRHADAFIANELGDKLNARNKKLEPETNKALKINQDRLKTLPRERMINIVDNIINVSILLSIALHACFHFAKYWITSDGTPLYRFHDRWITNIGLLIALIALAVSTVYYQLALNLLTPMYKQLKYSAQTMSFASVFNIIAMFFSVVALISFCLLEKYRLLEIEEFSLPNTTLAKSGLVLFYGAMVAYSVYHFSRYLGFSVYNGFTYLHSDTLTIDDKKEVERFYDMSRYGNPIAWTGTFIAVLIANVKEQRKQVEKTLEYGEVNSTDVNERSRSRSSSRTRGN